MPDDQQISQSVDNVIAGTPDEQSDQEDPSITKHSSFSLGSSPSTNNSSEDAIIGSPIDQPSTAPTDDGLVKVDQTPAGDSLDDIKKQALNQLTPLMSELDQAPAEKYRTLMMLIQASDDKTLIKEAFAAASSIEDKKAKAEALLNIVNEINYFSSNNSDNKENEQ
jgi:hypothetical protein